VYKVNLIKRPRRLRMNENLRNMVKETYLDVCDLVYPLFVVPGENVKEEIPSMSGIYRFSADLLLREIEEVRDLGIPAVLLFGVPLHKDELGSEAYSDTGTIQRAVRKIKEKIPGICVITDVCMCEYTTHGHCGIVEGGQVLNDATADCIAKIALSHVEAGADVVAPSDMMDGRVAVIRRLLDDSGFVDTPIMAYSAKYASSFYGPFRDAVDSVPQFGDRKSYQMDYRNSDEALREVELDIEEGADIVMVKPALSYLDVIRRIKDSFNIPVAAYNVSGEYAMIKAVTCNRWIEEKPLVLEVIASIKRAGADMVITYFAKDIARWLTTR